MKTEVKRKARRGGRSLSRRSVLRGLAAAPLISILGCTDERSGTVADGGAGAPSGAGSSGSAGVPSSAAGSGGRSTAGTAGASGSSTAWAAGGTAAMTALASYRNPFEEVDATCSVTCQTTEGPCHDDQAPEREDVSEGQVGLPLRFGLRILDDKCQPISDADVDVWHCDVRGVYSSMTADNPQFCTGDDAPALAARYFRGHRMTGADGVAWFSTCFPGWYSSRAIHVHFTVRRSSRTGSEYVTSQLGFASALIQEICGSHPDYAGHGQPDTANTSDTVFPAATIDDYLFETERMSDGSMLAWKTIIIRSSLADSVCGDMGGMPGGGPGMGGPPPRG
jgi:protocatechuate 3,4-dioxygenase beta subunit